MTRRPSRRLVLLLAAVALLLLGVSDVAIAAPALDRSSARPSAPSLTASTDVVATSIEAGSGGVCAVMSDRTARCWGINTSGQVGDGTTEDRYAPTAVSGLTNVAGISMGTTHACAVRTTGTVACWGANDAGQLGDGTTTGRTSPVTVSGLSDAIAVSAGQQFTCAVRSGGGLRCWGSNQFGRSGLGAASGATTPTDVAGISTATSVSAGVANGCAVLADRTARCWGLGSNGNIGDGTQITRTTPVAVPGATDVKAIEVGGEHTCALRFSGTVRCWGLNGFGQVGDTTTVTRLEPMPTSQVSLAGSLAAGTRHSCAGLANGSMLCWGWNAFGQLGDQSTTARSTPVQVTGLGGVRDVAAGANFSCALRSGGAIVCWGFNGQGQVGDATGTDRSAPVPVAGLTVLRSWPFVSWDDLADQVHLDMTGTPMSSIDRFGYVEALASGLATRGSLAHDLRQRDDSTKSVDPAVRLYRAFLGRAPDPSGLRFWIARRRTGSWSLVRMADQFASSSEFLRKYGTLTNRQFVTRIYTDVLGRTADQAGVDYWTRQLDLKRRNRGSVMVGFSESSEYKGKQAINTDLAVAYFFHLGRTPNAIETYDWVSRQQAGASQAQLLDELLDRADYARRIQTAG